MINHNKVVVIDAHPDGIEEGYAALGALAAVTAEKVKGAFDWCFVFSQDRTKKMNLKAAKTFLQEVALPQPAMLLLGHDTAKAFGVEREIDSVPFELHWQGGVHLAVWIKHPIRDAKRLKSFSDKMPVGNVVKDLLKISSIAVTEKDVHVVIGVINSTPEALSFWTKKIRDEILDNLSKGRTIDKIDLGQLMASYANDLSFVKPMAPQNLTLHTIKDPNGTTVGATTDQSALRSFMTGREGYTTEQSSTDTEVNNLPVQNN